MYLVQVVLQFLAGAVFIGQVNEQQVVVGTAGYQLHPAGSQAVRQSGGIFHDLAGVFLKGRLQRFPKADGLGGDHVFQRAALGAGEDGRIDPFDQVFVVGEDQAAPGTPEGLVGGGGHHVGVGHGVLVGAARYQTGNVGHIHHQHGAVAVGDLGQFFKIDGAGIGRSAGHQQLGPDLGHLLGQGGIINAAVLAHTVGNKVVVFAAHIHRGTVGQVAALGQIHAHDGIAHIQQRKVNGQVGLGAGMGLHVGVFGAEQLAGAVNGQLFHLVHILAAAVVAVTGVAFGVFVGQHTAHGRHYGRRNNVLAGDQLNVLALADQLPLHGGAQFRVGALHKTNGIHHVLVHFPFTSLNCKKYYADRSQRAFGGKHPVDPGIKASGGVQCLGKGLEHRFQFVVVVFSVQHLQVQVHGR